MIGAASDALQRVAVVVVVAAFCASSGVEREARERERERERGKVGRREKRRGEKVLSRTSLSTMFIPFARTTLAPVLALVTLPGLSAATPFPPPLPSAGAQSRATTEIRLAIIVDDKVEQCRTPRHEDVRREAKEKERERERERERGRRGRRKIPSRDKTAT